MSPTERIRSAYHVTDLASGGRACAGATYPQVAIFPVGYNDLSQATGGQPVEGSRA